MSLRLLHILFDDDLAKATKLSGESTNTNNEGSIIKKAKKISKDFQAQRLKLQLKLERRKRAAEKEKSLVRVKKQLVAKIKGKMSTK